MAQLPRMWRAWDFALLRSLAVRVSGDETPRSETKNFVTGGSASSMSFVFESLVPLALQVPRDAVRALNWPNCWGILHWGDPNAWSWLQMETLSSLYWTVNKSALCFGGRRLLYIPKIVDIQIFLKSVQKKSKGHLVPLFAGHPGMQQTYGKFLLTLNPLNSFKSLSVESLRISGQTITLSTNT